MTGHGFDSVGRLPWSFQGCDGYEWSSLYNSCENVPLYPTYLKCLIGPPPPVKMLLEILWEAKLHWNCAFLRMRPSCGSSAGKALFFILDQYLFVCCNYFDNFSYAQHQSAPDGRNVGQFSWGIRYQPVLLMCSELRPMEHKLAALTFSFVCLWKQWDNWNCLLDTFQSDEWCVIFTYRHPH